MCLPLSKDGLPSSARHPLEFAAHRTELMGGPERTEGLSWGPQCLCLASHQQAGRGGTMSPKRGKLQGPAGLRLEAGGGSHLRDSNKRSPNPPGYLPAQQLLMTLQEKGSRTLCSPWCRFPVCLEVSNVRSHPHSSLLEARPHIFRSGRGRARGLVKRTKGKWKE